MNGFLVALKPPGMTSHDVVAVVRGILGGEKVGHLGTLDPGAAGVLPLAVGQATRLIEYLPEPRKVYRLEILLGVETDTGDLFGEVVRRSDPSGVTLSRVESALEQFRGLIQQAPPPTSAVHVEGRRAYRLAFRGEAVELEPRPVHIYRLEMEDFTSPRVFLEMECSPGTYARSLARDVGQSLGCGATLAFLVRTRNGPFALETSLTLEEIRESAAAGTLEDCLVPGRSALEGIPQQVVRDAALGLLASGGTLRPVHLSTPPPGYPDRQRVILLDGRGLVRAMAEARTLGGLHFRPLKVFPLVPSKGGRP